MNEELVSILYEIADILEVLHVQWKPRAYKEAARAIENIDIVSIYKKKGLKGLEEIPGIGEGIGKKIVEYIKTGKVKEFEKLKKKAPTAHVLIQIKGMGPKKVEKLSKLEIHTVNDLEKAAKQGKIRGLEGFGLKSEQEILEGIALLKKTKPISYKTALKEANKIINNLKKYSINISVAGSLRRSEERRVGKECRSGWSADH